MKTLERVRVKEMFKCFAYDLYQLVTLNRKPSSSYVDNQKICRKNKKKGLEWVKKVISGCFHDRKQQKPNT